ncbi:MAG: hypothetical protein GXO19_07070 [Epsilonproteobacteria bacterium]|nr:hypothetical protein [Campylobacterota bacterium]NPA57475.1 hypothetical protein [Campylobacterota bacterium]
MSKIAQIRQIIRESRELVDEVTRDLHEAVNHYNLALEEHRVIKENIRLATLDELREALEGIENLPQKEAQPIVVEDGSEPLRPIDPPEPYEIEEPSAGLFKAKFWGFLTFLVALAAIVGVGALMRNVDPMAISPENWRESLEKAFGFYSSLITQSPDAGAALGVVVALAVAALLGYLVYFLIANGAASRNLLKAQEVFEEVQEWSEEQRRFIEKLRGVGEFLKGANRTLQGGKLFGDEFAARVKRARFFDGDDFAQMGPVARGESESAQELDLTLRRLSEMELYAKDFEIAQPVKRALEEGAQLVDRLKKRVYGG